MKEQKYNCKRQICCCSILVILNFLAADLFVLYQLLIKLFITYHECLLLLTFHLY